jgi:hypothetical protein
MEKRISILFLDKEYEIEVNKYYSIHHVISDLIEDNFEINSYKKLYYKHLLKSNDYIILNEKNEILSKNYCVDLCDKYTLIMEYNILIMLFYLIDVLGVILWVILVTNIIIQYGLMEICGKINNITFNMWNNLTTYIVILFFYLFIIIGVVLFYNLIKGLK